MVKFKFINKVMLVSKIRGENLIVFLLKNNINKYNNTLDYHMIVFF